MKITDIEIERFGIWRQLTLPLPGNGPHVFYGPNEAGKSTLKRFVRAMLFAGGWPGSRMPHAGNGRAGLGGRFPAGDGDASGSLTLTHQGKEYRLRRRSEQSGFGRVELSDSDGVSLPIDRLAELLSGTSEAVFDRLFSIDLFELQELSRLDHDELSGHVYGLSLGEDGQRLLRSVEELRQYKRQLCSDDGQRGRLPRLVAEEQALQERLRSLPDLPSRRAELLDRRAQVDADVETGKRRRGDIENDIRARRHLARVHPLWRRAQECRLGLSRFASVVDLPPDGLDQLDAMDSESRKLKRDRDEARRQADESSRRVAGLGEEPAIVRAEPAVRALLGMRSWVAKTQQARDAAPQEIQPAAPMPARAASPGELAAEWTPDRLARVDTTPAAQLTLTDAARRFRLATGRMSELGKRYRKERKTLQRREQSAEDRLTALGTTPDAAAATLRRELASAEKRAELRTAEAVLTRRGGTSRHRSQSLAEAMEIPPWVTLVLALFAIGGAIFVILGLVTGVTHSAIAGAAYLLLGLTSGSLAVKLKSHYENTIAESTDHAGDQRQDDEVELRRIREEMRRLGVAPRDRDGRSDWQAPSPSASAEAGGIAETVRLAVKKFGDLDDLVSSQARIQSRRKELTRLRERLRAVQREVETERREWCDTLTQLGLPENLDIDQSLKTWQQIAASDGDRARQAGATSQRAGQLMEAGLVSFGKALEQLGRKLEIWNGPAGQPLAILDDFERQLDQAIAQAGERRRHQEDHKRQMNQVRHCEERLAELARQRTSMLAAAGVRSREDYEERLQSAAEREQCQEALRLAERELETVAAAEPDLALVEDDLTAFRDDLNRDDIHRLVREREELEAKLESAHEQRGTILRQLTELEGDRRAADLSRGKSRVESILRRTSSRLLAASLACEAAEAARMRYEQDRQPAVLEAASEILARLTRGRYKRIFSPLDERTLRVADERGKSFAVEALSGGTREQLLLALRLGMVRRAAEQEVELPLILDDVFVNFDQLRTEAAFETLQELAESGRQILFFTCHLHLANLAEQRGAAPIWLPEREGPPRQRLAG